MAKRYYWLKLKEDFFNSKPMLKLRKIAGGDTYTIIYLKLQLLSLKNEGKLYFDNIEDSFADELALEIGEDADNVKVTLLYLQKFGLLEYASEDEIMLHEVPLSIGKETASAERVRRYREKQKALQCNSDVTTCNTEIEKDIDIDTDIKKRERVDYQLIADMYNDTCVSFPKLKTLSDTRKKAIKARLHTYTNDDFKLLFAKAEASDFLKGKNARDWQASFDWLIKDANMAKVLDGNYDNKEKAQSISNTTANQVEEMLKRQEEINKQRAQDPDNAPDYF